MSASDEELARRLQAEENAIAAQQLPAAYPVQIHNANIAQIPVARYSPQIQPTHHGQIAVAVPVNPQQHQVIQAQALPFGQHFGQMVVMEMPPLSADEQRLIPVFKLARIIMTFSLIDSFFIVLWAMMLRFFPLLLLAPLAICGYYAGRRFNRGLAICYLGYSFVYCVSIALLIFYKKLWFLACLNIIIEIWIARLNLRFIQELARCAPADILTLQQSSTLARGNPRGAW
jgi:hypothetical protein